MVQFLLSLHAKTIVCFLYSRNLKVDGKGFRKDVTHQKLSSIQKVYNKDFKITSIETILVNLLQNLKMFSSVEITLEATTQNNFSKTLKLSREMIAAEFHYA